MSRLRIVNLGLPKSGTSTLSRALRVAGFKVADHKIRRMHTDNPDLQKKFVGELIYQGHFRAGDPLDGLDEFDAFCELSLLRDGASLWPQTDWGVLAAMIRNHPGLRFVATRRDPFDISQSMLKWNNLGLDRLPRLDLPGLPAGYGETTRERCQWIEAHYSFLDRVFAGDTRFMMLDVAEPDAPDRLARHLGRDIPWWGVANANDEGAA